MRVILKLSDFGRDVEETDYMKLVDAFIIVVKLGPVLS